tara:strand:- start:429 stop:722 length:294 start_codon:yes stop_codon:yes gene_type:complete
MAKPNYTKAKSRIKKLYYMVPLINSRLALRYLQKSDLPSDEIPNSHVTIQNWFDGFEKISDKIRQQYLLSIFQDYELLDDINFIVNDKEIIQLKKEK